MGLQAPACRSPPAHKLPVGQVVLQRVNHKDVDSDKHENDKDDEIGHIPSKPLNPTQFLPAFTLG